MWIIDGVEDEDSDDGVVMMKIESSRRRGRNVSRGNTMQGLAVNNGSY